MNNFVTPLKIQQISDKFLNFLLIFYFVHRFLSIAQYLIENNADLAAVNSDGDLAIDLSESDRMHDLLKKHLIEQGIDCDEARQSEEKLMIRDAECWLRSDASEADRSHPRTGATPMHVAAAKGYVKVLGLLLASRADVNKQDNDGWTPLHAAARWGQKESAQMLVASGADVDIKNYAGQTAIDVADTSMIKLIEELQKTTKRNIKRRPQTQIRINDNIYNHTNETPQKVIRVEVKGTDDGKCEGNYFVLWCFFSKLIHLNQFPRKEKEKLFCFYLLILLSLIIFIYI